VKEGQAGIGSGTGKKRPLYVNDMYCESLAEAAVCASEVLHRKVRTWEMQRVADGEAAIEGITVRDKALGKPKKSPPLKMRTKGTSPLLVYPYGESPLDRGLPERWR